MKTTFFLSLFLFTCTAFSQTQFWIDDFEGTTPSSGVRTPENNGGVGGPPFTSYFCRTPANGTVSQSVPFTGFQGTNYWAGEDQDAAGTGFAGAGTSAMSVRQQDITWTSINIVGKTTLSFTGSLAANSTNQPFDNRNACSGGATTNTDYVIVQYKIDAGPWNDGLRFFTNGALTGKYLFLETTGDSCGDGTQLTNVFQNFSFNIVGTGTTLNLRLLVYSEGGNEEWGADNFRLFEVSSLPVELSSFSTACVDKKEQISWTSQTETRLQYYELEQSTDAQEYHAIGQTKAAGSSETALNYSVILPEGAPQQAYYRLKMVDQDGIFRYSDVISSIDCEQGTKLLESFTGKDNALTLHFREKNVQFELVSPTGQRITPLTDSGNELQQTVAVGRGIYVLIVTDDLQSKKEVYRVFVD